MTEAIHLPTIMREQLRWETGTLQLFTEVIPFLRPCSVPLLPLPVVEWPTPLASKETPGTSIGKPSLLSLLDDSQTQKIAGLMTTTPTQATPTGSIPK